jgi:hypothetical protein
VNLDEMLENHEFRRWGEGVEGNRFSSEAVLAELDRVSAVCFSWSGWLLLSTAGDGEELGAGLGAGVS